MPSTLHPFPTEDITGNWALGREFTPSMDPARRERLYAGWKKAVTRSLDWEEHA